MMVFRLDKPKLFRIAQRSLAAILCTATLVLCVQITLRARENQQRMTELAEISDIKYGLFSINQWKQKLSQIVSTEVARMDISKDDRKQLKPVVEEQLETLIDAVYRKIEQRNQQSLKGRLKQAFIESVVDLKDIKAGIPAYADQMIAVLEKPATKNEIKGVLLDKVGEYFDRTFEEQDLSRVNQIVSRAGATDVNAAQKTLVAVTSRDHRTIRLMTWSMIGAAVLLFLLAATQRRPLPPSFYGMLVLTLLALLITGVGTPMINLEAKITEMSFVLFDQPVQFLDQVLYFQSKSVLDVFWIMVTHQDLQMKIVGVLMVAFSVVFPLLKLLSSAVYFFDLGSLRESRLVRFFVLKSGKWSMTDVMIIAIFMAYIGFNGIIASQFGKLHTADSEIVLLTTNGTSLQPGFYLFFTYAVLALFFSEFLTVQPSKLNLEA